MHLLLSKTMHVALKFEFLVFILLLFIYLFFSTVLSVEYVNSITNSWLDSVFWFEFHQELSNTLNRHKDEFKHLEKVRTKYLVNLQYVEQKIKNLNDKLEKVKERHSLLEVKQIQVIPFHFNCRIHQRLMTERRTVRTPLIRSQNLRKVFPNCKNSCYMKKKS